ncbi:rifin [Plasmodium reichenowi]|uniref:Rifin n=1 Tax=Plasmodium reichenowi TaxID=5854 RepID=A0A060RM61_PLARE|nr:rifin [Plasmodium reichenowi]
MKVHYFNILLFASPLNILEHNQRNHKNTTLNTQNNRSLCECELYSPDNYDNDPQMKEVIENFNKQTQQRLREYDDRMVEKRKQCKDNCDKEIQKIILKDKLEKQMEEQLSTLETKIHTDDIPTCVCEKSLADKTEKFCLNCGMNVGGGVTLSSGVLGGIGEAAISVLKPLAITAAKAEAVTEATNAAIEAGMKAVISEINVWSKHFTSEPGFVNLITIVNKTNFKCSNVLHDSAVKLANNTCMVNGKEIGGSFCSTIWRGGKTTFEPFAKVGTTTYDTTLSSQTATLTKAKVGAVKATYAGYEITIIASIVAIVVIVLIMVIIYLALRYRRKKKMKKKLQYIKLLEE